MYLRNKEHNPPHVHAITQDFDAPFSIATGEIMEGEFPPKAQALRNSHRLYGITQESNPLN